MQSTDRLCGLYAEDDPPTLTECILSFSAPNDAIAFLHGYIKRAGQDGRGLSAEECTEIAEALSKRMGPSK